MKWKFAGIGWVVGVLFYIFSDEFMGLNNVDQIAIMVGVGIPFAFIGLIVGLVIAKLRK
jgi:hypothetical protein